MPTEHPILFTGPMVRAILEGTKTQTRRVLKLRDGMLVLERARHHVTCAQLRDGIGPVWSPYAGAPEEPLPKNLLQQACPYGLPGDRLWVRETLNNDDGDWVYAAGYTPLSMDYPEKWARDVSSKGYIPSIHMPRWASRINLKVTGIRVERVQEITEDEAFAEGISGGDWLGNPVGEFAKLWDSINAKRAEKIMFGEPWDGWTWAESSSHDPEGLALDIAEPAEIRWRNLADHDEAEWMRFGDSQPCAAGMYDVIWEKGDKPRNVYLAKCAEEERRGSEFRSYAWEMNPWVWVVEFEKTSNHQGTKSTKTAG